MFVENFNVYDVRMVWRQMLREGHDVARCAVESLMRKLGGKRVRNTARDRRLRARSITSTGTSAPTLLRPRATSSRSMARR